MSFRGIQALVQITIGIGIGVSLCAKTASVSAEDAEVSAAPSAKAEVVPAVARVQLQIPADKYERLSEEVQRLLAEEGAPRFVMNVSPKTLASLDMKNMKKQITATAQTQTPEILLDLSSTRLNLISKSELKTLERFFKQDADAQSDAACLKCVEDLDACHKDLNACRSSK